MKIRFDLDEDKKELVISISELDIKELRNMSNFLDDPSDIYVGITDDAILILLEKNLKSLLRTFSASKYDFLYISPLGTFLINRNELKKEFNDELKSDDNNIFDKFLISIERKEGEDE
jgi:hypothetical protein